MAKLPLMFSSEAGPEACAWAVSAKLSQIARWQGLHDSGPATVGAARLNERLAMQIAMMNKRGMQYFTNAKVVKYHPLAAHRGRRRTHPVALLPGARYRSHKLPV